MTRMPGGLPTAGTTLTWQAPQRTCDLVGAVLVSAVAVVLLACAAAVLIWQPAGAPWWATALAETTALGLGVVGCVLGMSNWRRHRRPPSVELRDDALMLSCDALLTCPWVITLRDLRYAQFVESLPPSDVAVLDLGDAVPTVVLALREPTAVPRRRLTALVLRPTTRLPRDLVGSRSRHQLVALTVFDGIGLLAELSRRGVRPRAESSAALAGLPRPNHWLTDAAAAGDGTQALAAGPGQGRHRSGTFAAPGEFTFGLILTAAGIWGLMELWSMHLGGSSDQPLWRVLVMCLGGLTIGPLSLLAGLVAWRANRRR